MCQLGQWNVCSGHICLEILIKIRIHKRSEKETGVLDEQLQYKNPMIIKIQHQNCWFGRF